ncbi:MAG: SDR family NAD(P)-dependent oxidoreductase [Alphaproteobacteria bacterium]
MDLGLDGKVVFIAGASRGIGYAMAEAFVGEGAKVCITGRTESVLQEAAEKLAGDVLAVAGDMTSSADVIRALDRTEAELGPVYCAVANVGIGRAPLGFDITDDDWDADIAQNLTGSMYVAREAIRRMMTRPPKERAGANIIMISSIAGVDSIGTPLTYSATKAAINHAGRSLAKFVGPDGIRVNVIAPGNILFPGGSWEKITAEKPEVWDRWIKREVALQRFGTVEEIADAALFLASERSAFTTGEVFVVDGGQVQ